MSEIINSLFKALSERQRDVLVGRFGLDKAKEPQTLAALGERFHVTRERIRQIEMSALAAAREGVATNADCREIITAVKACLKKNGGVARVAPLLEHLHAVIRDLNENQLAFLVAASREVQSRPEDDEYHPFYYSDERSMKAATSFATGWIETLRKNKGTILGGRYQELLQKSAAAKHLTLPVAATYVGLSKHIHANPFGDVGLGEWPEIRPATVRDQIYLVLKKHSKPLHFQTIAATINDIGLHPHRALAPTVHNELIKDPRFVLVGRGIYGLSEHGYQPGTAREVIQRILKNQGPLKPKDVILAVQRERFLKANTVLVNLQNRNHFERLTDGSYQVREA